MEDPFKTIISIIVKTELFKCQCVFYCWGHQRYNYIEEEKNKFQIQFWGLSAFTLKRIYFALKKRKPLIQWFIWYSKVFF